MDIRASEWAVVVGRPSFCIERFADPQIERQLRNNLPSEAYVRPASHTIDRRRGIGIKHVVFVAIDAVGPFARIEPLEPETER